MQVEIEDEAGENYRIVVESLSDDDLVIKNPGWRDSEGSSDALNPAGPVPVVYWPLHKTY